VPEVIDDGVTGFVVDSIEDAVEAVGRIQWLDRARCRRVFEERFDVARMARDYVDVYRRLASEVRSPGPEIRSQAPAVRSPRRPTLDFRPFPAGV
jgi:hypothetical protein